MAQAGEMLLGGFATFFHWWAEGLADLVPPSLKTALRRADEPLVIEIDDTMARFGFRSRETGELTVHRTCTLTASDSREQREARAWLARRGRRKQRAVLRLPHSQCLVRVLSLPLAAEENLRRVLEFEMDRNTPYSAAEVYFGCEILDRVEASRRLFVRLVVCERATIDKALQQAAAYGLYPVLAEVPDPETGKGSFHTVLLNGAESETSTRRRGAAPIILGALALTLLLTAILLPLWQRRWELEKVEHLTASAHAAASKAAQAKARLAAEGKTARFLANRRRTTPLTIALVDELTRLVPDDAYLDSLKLKDGKLTIRGEAKSATKLIGLLAGSKYFRNPAFSAPVQADLQNGLERFTLKADVAQAGAR